MDTIGERIAYLRKKKGLDQQVLGDLLGVSKQQVSRYEKGLSILNVDQSKIIAKALGTTVSYLIEGAEAQDSVSESYAEIAKQVKSDLLNELKEDIKSYYTGIIEEGRKRIEEDKKQNEQSKQSLKNIPVVPPDKS